MAGKVTYCDVHYSLSNIPVECH